jgi:hypothetical protein
VRVRVRVRLTLAQGRLREGSLSQKVSQGEPSSGSSVTDQARKHCIQGKPESAAGSLGKGLGSRPQHCKCSYRIALPSGLVALLLFQRSTAIASIVTLGCASAQRPWSPPLQHGYNVKPRLKRPLAAAEAVPNLCCLDSSRSNIAVAC